MIGIDFFKPGSEMADWIIEYANDRFIIDVGGGTGHLVKLLTAKGGKCVIIEPQLDYALWTQMQMMNNTARIHLFPGDIEHNTNMVKSMCKDNKSMIVFARPCHALFVEYTLGIMPKGSEALYITVPENKEKYCDLGKYDDQAILLKHKGTSVDNEVVYSVKI